MIIAIKKKVNATKDKTIKYKIGKLKCILGYNSNGKLAHGMDYCGWVTINEMDIDELLLICYKLKLLRFI